MKEALIAILVIAVGAQLAVKLYVAARRWEIRRLNPYPRLSVDSQEFRDRQAKVQRVKEHLWRLGFSSCGEAGIDQMLELSFKMHATSESICDQRHKGSLV